MVYTYKLTHLEIFINDLHLVKQSSWGGNMIISNSFELENIQLIIFKEYFYLFIFLENKNTFWYN